MVDGPWELTSFEPTAPVVFKPNPTYSGPNSPKIKKYVEEPFASDAAEFNALVSGTIDYGYLPVTDIISSATKEGKPGKELTVGQNNPRLTTYKMEPLYLWAFAFVPYNFNSTGDTGEAGAIYSQLYIRQAFQDLVNQTLYVRSIYKGYGYDDYGPVPTLPTNSYASKAELKNPYPYSVSAARKLLRSRGWKVVPSGSSVCEKPGSGSGHCGAGIKKGAKLIFTFLYLSGTPALKEEMSAEKSSWSQVGIQVTLRSATADTVYGEAVPCPKGCSWEFGGPTLWGYLPDYYPTGEEIFATGAEANYGSYTTAHNNALIKSTDVSNVSLTKYENYLEKELPVLWEPEPITIYEVRKGLKGATPLGPFWPPTPATWHWST